MSAGSSGFTNFSRVSNNYSLYSQFGRVNYTYADKYIFEGVVRRDGSSKFGSDSRYGVFPSVSAGWVISKENFFKDVSFVNNLKIRGSWGKLGNYLNVDPNNAFNLYGGTPDGFSTGSYYDINGTSTSSVQGFTATRIGNPQTSWEEDVLTNVGLDAVLFKNKLDFTFEWYNKKINGLLFQDQVPIIATGGAAAPTINIGDIKNTGIDLSATYHGTINRDFKFDVGLIFSRYKNEITSIPGTGGYFDDGYSRIGAFVRNQVGQATGAFFGYKVIGIFQDQADVDKSPTQDQAKAGRFKYLDANGDDVITDQDRVFFGNPNPDFTYGLNLGATYKGFDFSMFLYGSQGNDLINYVRYWTDFYPSFQGVKSKDALYNSWSPDNPNAKLVQLSDDANFSTNQTVNSYYLEDGSYLRCKSLVIGYTLPSSLLKKIHVDRCRFYVQAANLFTITNYTGLDPELSGYTTAFGIDFGNYPNNQRNFNVGVNLSF
ncbi:MAG TPA: SusC/RagA family TonB-linked outer membrane protein [Panacibacter sp.]|nr:SusC/RagA family TonB-linked outer membrane protein [Panacibacter sp.]